MARSSNTAATYEAQFHDGRPQFVDITAAANIAAGQVVAGANTVPVYICHEAITSGDKGVSLVAAGFTTSTRRPTSPITNWCIGTTPKRTSRTRTPTERPSATWSPMAR